MIKKVRNILITIITLGLFCLPLIIKIKIECKSQYGICPDSLNTKLQTINGKYLFQAKREVSKILKNDAMVSVFSTQYKLPNVITVNTIIKKPIYALKDNLSGKIFTVEANGEILAEVGSTSLPMVIQDGTNPNLIALNLMLGIYQMYQVLYGTITNDALVVDMPRGVRVLFPLDGERDTEVLLGSLRLIYTKVTTDYLGTYSQIDMRYKNPVLR